MSKYKKRLRTIDYTSRDYESIRGDLIEHAKRYYSDTFQDFSEASFGALMIDSVAYIGDILSFYLDYQVNESFLDSSNEFNNILRHGKALGYKYQGRGSATGEVTLYIIVPANETGMGPDSDYIPALRAGAAFVGNGVRFTLISEVRFDQPTNEVVVARVDETTGLPTHYAIKSYGQVISGNVRSMSVKIGEFEKFRNIVIGDANVSEIISVTDSDGNKYYEVDYLTQDVVYKEIVNKNVSDDRVRSILKPITVPRRFVTTRSRAATFLQFGYGSETQLEKESVLDPKNIVLDLYGKDYSSEKSFDPSKLLTTDKFGIGPANTTLNITFRQNSAQGMNVMAGGIKRVVNKNFVFENQSTIVSSRADEVITSLEVHNEQPILGDVFNPTTDEIRHRISGVFATQNRAVTKEDYESFALMMPQKFGLVKRVNVVRDPDSTKRNLNMYILSENEVGNFTSATTALKRNLKTWLSRYKMMTDAIDILDAKVVNIGINYSITVKPSANKFDVLTRASVQLAQRYEEKFYIGEPFYISEVYSILNRITDILDVVSVDVVQKRTFPYSNVRFDLDANTSPNGSYIVVPKNVVLEFRYPARDIQGSIA